MKKQKSYEEDEKEETDNKSGWEDEAVKGALLLIGLNNSDKSKRDNQNIQINEILKEASEVTEPTLPRFIGAKRLKQAKSKTIERIQPLSWTLQGDGATEEEEILVTKAVKEALHRGGYDSTFTAKGGIIDKIITYGNGYRMIVQRDKKKTAFPVGFKMIDSNNLWMTVGATSFRNGNKNVTQIVALFRGTMREFNEQFPEYEDMVTPGYIPRAFSYKDLDQTSTQHFQSAYAAGTDAGDDDGQEIEWAYYFDIYEKCYVLFAGAELTVLEKKEGKEYPYKFKNLEGKEECYIPVMNYICIPAEEGIYDVGIIALLFDMGIVFRQSMNWDIGRTRENAYPHTYVSIPQGQESQFFNLVDSANQMRAAGQTAYIPFTFNPNNPGQVASATPILNGGDPNAGAVLRSTIDDEFRKCGVYLDEPVNGQVTATQIEYNASNALTLPKAIMKYNHHEIEFELMVALDMLKNQIKKDDPTPLILETTVDLPDGTRSIRGIPFSLGWLKEQLMARQWRPQVDPNSGAVTNDVMLLTLYQKMLPTMDPASPEYAAINKKIALLTGTSVPKTNPAEGMLAADAAQPGGEPPPPPTANQAAGLVA